MTNTHARKDISADLEFIITRTFNAPRELVWQAWTEIDLLERWICPKDFKVTFCQGELRVGGKWRTGMQSPEGTEHICGGIYREIAPPSKLVFTHAWEDEDGEFGPQTLVSVTLSEEKEKTLMRFEQTRFDSVESRDGHEDGWTGAFDNLNAYLNKGRHQY